MSAIATIAMQFFDACEKGKGWEACKSYCKPDATFSAQAEPLAEVRTLQQYADWMQGLMKMMPDGRYDLKSFATDAERNNVTAYAVFSGTHTGQGGLRLYDGVRRRQDPAHDQDLECRLGAEGTGLVKASTPLQAR
jgi:predicted ester cyclase